jgi:prevent-host-death family protein
MRTVNIAELKNKLSAYLTYAKAGEEILIRDRNRPIAMLVPFVPGDASEEELELVAQGKMTLPKKPYDPARVVAMPKATMSPENYRRNAVTQALLDEREEGR